MNNYVERLNFPVPNGLDLSVFKKGNRSHIRTSPDIFGSEVEKLLNRVGVKVRWVEAFYLGENMDHTIHCDGHELDTKAKLNLIFGGEDSEMVWYDCIDNSKIEKRTSNANTIYLGTDIDNVVEVHKTVSMNGFYLVNIGMFHNVWNKEHDRYCLSSCLEDMRTGHRLDYTELQKRMKEYIL